MDLAPGTPVTDNVRLVKPLGEGGMGSVWVAEHASLNTSVAVKFISKELLEEDSSMAQRFAREASLSAQIKSPYVVQTFDHGVTPDGQPYIVMELLEGESLDERLERETTLSLDLTNMVVTQTAKALSKAHKHGIVHRDIKPDNIFLTWEEEELFAKVLDFGVAKRTNLPTADSVTGTGMMVGTPEYMSPEQVLSAKSVDHRADLWALAVVAYRCLTGRAPFTGETLGSLCVAIAGGAFTPPTQLRADLAPSVDQWFHKGLAVETQERFDSARELAQSFSMALLGKVTDEFSGSGLRGAPADWSGAHAATSGANISISGVQGGSPTFAGTTVAPDQGTKARTALVSVGATLLIGAGIAAAVAFSGDETSSSEPAAEPTSATRPPDGEVLATAATDDVSAAPDGSGEPGETDDDPSEEDGSETDEAGSDEDGAAEGDGGAAGDDAVEPVIGAQPTPKPLAQPPFPGPTSNVAHDKPAPVPTSTKDRGF